MKCYELKLDPRQQDHYNPPAGTTKRYFGRFFKNLEIFTSCDMSLLHAEIHSGEMIVKQKPNVHILEQLKSNRQYAHAGDMAIANACPINQAAISFTPDLGRARDLAI